MHSVQVASCVGLTFSVWELVVTFREQVEVAWRRPLRFTWIKLLYLFCRYFEMGAQICNMLIAEKINAYTQIPKSMCRSWLIYQIVITFSLLHALDVILILRVYLFYQRKKWIGNTLLGLWITRILILVAAVVESFPKLVFDARCQPRIPHSIVVTFMVLEIALQTLIVSMTLAPHALAARTTRMQSPLLPLIYWRDGVLVYTFIFASFGVIIFHERAGSSKDSPHFIFPVFITLLSSTTCRLIGNMQEAVRKVTMGYYSEDIIVGELTTIFQDSFEEGDEHHRDQC